MTWNELELKRKLKKTRRALIEIGGLAIIGIAGTVVGIRIHENRINAKPAMSDTVMTLSEQLPKMDLSVMQAINTDHWIESDGLDKFIVTGVRLSDLGNLGKKLSESMEVDEAITSLAIETIEVV